MRIRAKASIPCQRTFRIDMQIQHGSEIEIASDRPKFHCNCVPDFFDGVNVTQPSKLRSRRPCGEWLSKRKPCSTFLIDANQHRASGGLADFQSELPQPLGTFEISLV